MSRKLLPGLLVCLGLLALAYATTVHAAETRRIGNTDGQEFVSECPPDRAVVGWNYNSDDRLRAIVALCLLVDPATGSTGGVARPTDDQLFGGDFGPNGGGGSGKRTCNDRQHVRSIAVNLTSTLTVHSLRATCHGPGTAPVLVAPTDLAAGAPGQAAKGTADCGTDSYATALVGTFKNTGPAQGILSLGLRCAAIGEAAAADAGNGNDDDGGNDQADRGDDDEGNGPGGFEIDIDIGPDGVRIGGGNRRDGGRVRIAEEPTTVYARKAGREIAYLDQGERVTIVECEDDGQGWCQISRPTEGWVWGGDLN